jgi:hypothetical protein
MSEVLDPLARRKAWFCTLAGAAVGMGVGLLTLAPGFIAGTGGKWVRPENDYVAYLVAWHYYVVDAWRLPLFDLPAMGYPEGGSVLFNDALPLTAVPTKILYQLTGARINPFGWWILLTYVLQGAMAARLVWAAGARSVWASAAAAVLAVVNIAFASRMGHTALSSHFLLLWALAIYFETMRRERARIGEMTLLLALTLLVNSYLFVMVFAFELATLCALWWRGQLRLRDVGLGAAGVVAVAVLGIVAGYGVFLTDPSTMQSQGFGKYSWNLVGLLVPPSGIFGFFEGVPRDATHGQYEGEAFIGIGALLVLALIALSSPRQALAAIRRHWIYVTMLVVFAAYAASNLVYAGRVLIVNYPLPTFALELGNYFRATGRFIWPLGYSLTILPVAAMWRWWPRALALPLIVLAAAIQLHRGMPGIELRRERTTQAYQDLVDSPRLTSWLEQHQRLWQYPSWWCGGLAGPRRVWPSDESNRELQVQLAAARVGVPSNSVYTSRMMKSCPTEAAWAQKPRLEDGVLYMLGPDAVAASPALLDLSRSNACVTLEWAVICSTRWARLASERGAAAAGR